MICVIPIPTLFDNYTYLIICQKTKQAAILDCPEVEPVLKVIEEEKVKPVAIFCTHHHADHVAGNEELVEKFSVPVYGSYYDRDRIPQLSKTLHEGNIAEVGQLKFKIIDIPGHTLGHIAYYGHNSLFCGDTLFAGGCGRLFEGTAAMMANSLSKLRNLPDETRIYCGHEYTQKNLEFAFTFEKENICLNKKIEEVNALRKINLPSIPTTLGEEKKYNPFLRWDDPILLEMLNKSGAISGLQPEAVFAQLRKMKDNY